VTFARPGRRRLWWAGLVVTALAVPLLWTPRRGYIVSIAAWKLVGRLNDVPWSVLWVGHLVDLSTAVTGQSSLISVRPDQLKPADAAAALASGRQHFVQTCGGCHGPEAAGAVAPSLLGGTAQALTDWDLFAAITRGIPGTEMRPQALNTRAAWEVVAWIRQRQAAPSSLPAAGNAPRVPVTAERLLAAAPDDGWLSFARTYDGSRFSPLSDINRQTVARLRPRWVRQLPYDRGATIAGTPLVSGDLMYVSVPSGGAYAIELGTGRVRWKHIEPARWDEPGRPGSNRGPGLSGDIVAYGTNDGRLVGLDAATGRRRWIVDLDDGERLSKTTSAPLAVGDAFVVGVGGGDEGARGALVAVVAATGQIRWRLPTVPARGDPDAATWGGAEPRGGGAWMTGTYDPATGLLFWGVGQPYPNLAGLRRPGANLPTDALLAIEAATGRVRWRYQFTEHDEFDWDATEVPILAADCAGGVPCRSLVVQANRNAFAYVLDRATGRLVRAAPFATQTWSDRRAADGAPLRQAGLRPNRTGLVLRPGLNGATNWWPPAYIVRRQLLLVPVREQATLYVAADSSGGGQRAPSGYFHDVGTPWYGVRALALPSLEQVWETALPDGDAELPPYPSGLLATAGELAFIGHQGTLYAIDYATGAVAWQYPLGGGLAAPPITVRHGGAQLLLVVSGRNVVAFNLAH
jgi:alcohol dehydrogenase (cytochrome c)